MSTRLLSLGFGIRRRQYVSSSRYHGGATIFTVDQDPASLACSACEARHLSPKSNVCGLRMFPAAMVSLRFIPLE